MVDRLQDMVNNLNFLKLIQIKNNWFNWKGIAKPKLSIGDTDTEISKKLIESKPHCQISNLPKDVFDLIVNYVQK